MALAGVDAGADRAPRRGLARGGGGARRRGDRAPRRGRRDRDHRDRRARAAAARPSRSGRSACRSPRAAGRGSTARSSCPATARWCASARRPSRCTCCGGCSMAAPTERLFVALDLPAAARAALAAFRDAEADPERLAARAPTRRCTSRSCSSGTGREGESDARRGGRCAACAGPAADLALGPALLLPPRRARVLCAEVEDRAGALAALQARRVGRRWRRPGCTSRSGGRSGRTPRWRGCGRARARRGRCGSATPSRSRSRARP